MPGIRYNFNIVKKELNKYGIRVPSLILGGLKYSFKQLPKLNHDLVKYSTPTFLSVDFDLDSGKICIKYLAITSEYVQKYALAHPKYYTPHYILKNITRPNSYARGRDVFENDVTINARDDAYDVISKVACALKELHDTWNALLDVYRSPTYKSYFNTLKARREQIRQINANFNAQLKNGIAAMQNQYLIRKEG